jgi:hypothetical protein
MNFHTIFRPCQKEGNTTSSGDINYNPGNTCRYKPKPPPRNPNTTKTSKCYYVSNETFPYQDQNSQRQQMQFSLSKTISQGPCLTHDDLTTNTKITQYNAEKERGRDICAEDADVSSQSSSSGVNYRSSSRLQSDLGKVLNILQN